METAPPKTNNVVIASGLALFSMFFGAGNVVFPLALGQYAQDKTTFAILGLLITAVGVPLAGVLAITLFNGNYQQFFARIGKVPGFLLALIIMGLIGPFGALPRCIALSYSTAKMYLPSVSLTVFSLISCLIIFLFTFRKNKIMDILGYVLTPLLLIALAVIIIKGFFVSPAAPEAAHTHMTSFIHGLKEGYQTMDLLGSFFFSGVVLVCLKEALAAGNPDEKSNYKKLVKLTLQAGAIGGFLLALVYIGFSYVAAFNSESLSTFPPDELFGALATQILGPYAGIVASIAVALACLTTAIAIAAVFAEFILEEVFRGKISYVACLTITLITAFFVSTLDFKGIVKFLGPILQICYPALIMLCLLNIAYKLFDFKPIKLPVLAVFLASVISYFI